MSRFRVALIVAAWCACVTIGLTAMLDYEMTPAPIAIPSGQWPATSKLAHDPRRPTLLMFVHPHCPCSRASLSEMNILASQCGDRVAVQIVFVRPAGFDDGWEQTDLFATAQRIRGARVLCDRDGLEATRFGATASGETLLFSREGRLMFQGGITPSRGHEGDNAGRATVTALIESGKADSNRSPVFGCALSNRCRPEEQSQALCRP
ncbi:MAG TPA: hypothetical protein VGY55_09135 [Pirellulales bacterium]|jgi:hypothetical protein|nr:hypothetical protein [Pirellulales bacterium]